MDRFLLEIAIESADDAQAAQRGGADRLELCSALELGGLTPTPGTVQEVLRVARVPVVAMLRPRPGGFCYNAGEIAAMRTDVGLLRSAGIREFAFGLLSPDGAIDTDACRGLIEACGGAACFHRALDTVADATAALERLVQLGFSRVLTSGGCATAQLGAERIAQLVQHAAGRIEIVSAGGVRAPHVQQLVRSTGCRAVHAGCRVFASSPAGPAEGEPVDGAGGRPRFGFGSGRDDRSFSITDEVQVAELRRALDGITPGG